MFKSNYFIILSLKNVNECTGYEWGPFAFKHQKIDLQIFSGNVYYLFHRVLNLNFDSNTKIEYKEETANICLSNQKLIHF